MNLLARARRGETITLIDKVQAETCLADLDAMRVALSARGQELTEAEAQAFTLRRAELMRGKP